MRKSFPRLPSALYARLSKIFLMEVSAHPSVKMVFSSSRWLPIQQRMSLLVSCLPCLDCMITWHLRTIHGLKPCSSAALQHFIVSLTNLMPTSAYTPICFIDASRHPPSLHYRWHYS